MLAKHLELRDRTQQFAFRVLHVCRELPRTAECDTIRRQLVRSGTSVAANYRAAGRCRTRAEFAQKIRVVLEEADESVFWLAAIKELGVFGAERLDPLLSEANELMRIFSASLRTLQHGKEEGAAIDHQVTRSSDHQMK